MIIEALLSAALIGTGTYLLLERSRRIPMGIFLMVLGGCVILQSAGTLANSMTLVSATAALLLILALGFLVVKSAPYPTPTSSNDKENSSESEGTSES